MNTPTSTNSQYSYFVAYKHAAGSGSIEILRDAPMNSMEMVADTGNTIAQHLGYPAVAIIGFQLLSGPTDRAEEAHRQVMEVLNFINAGVHYGMLGISAVDQLVRKLTTIASTLATRS